MLNFSFLPSFHRFRFLTVAVFLFFPFPLFAVSVSHTVSNPPPSPISVSCGVSCESSGAVLSMKGNFGSVSPVTVPMSPSDCEDVKVTSITASGQTNGYGHYYPDEVTPVEILTASHSINHTSYPDAPFFGVFYWPPSTVPSPYGSERYEGSVTMSCNFSSGQSLPPCSGPFDFSDPRCKGIGDNALWVGGKRSVVDLALFGLYSRYPNGSDFPPNSYSSDTLTRPDGSRCNAYDGGATGNSYYVVFCKEGPKATCDDFPDLPGCREVDCELTPDDPFCLDCSSSPGIPGCASSSSSAPASSSSVSYSSSGGLSSSGGSVSSSSVGGAPSSSGSGGGDSSGSGSGGSSGSGGTSSGSGGGDSSGSGGGTSSGSGGVVVPGSSDSSGLPTGVSCTILRNCDWSRIDVQLQELGVSQDILRHIRGMASLDSAGYVLSSQQDSLLRVTTSFLSSLRNISDSTNSVLSTFVHGKFEQFLQQHSKASDSLHSRLGSIGGKLDSGFGSIGGKLDSGFGGMGKGLDGLGGKLDSGFGGMGKGLDGVEKAVGGVEKAVDGVGSGVTRLGTKLDSGFAGVNRGLGGVGSKIDSGFGGIGGLLDGIGGLLGDLKDFFSGDSSGGGSFFSCEGDECVKMGDNLGDGKATQSKVNQKLKEAGIDSTAFRFLGTGGGNCPRISMKFDAGNGLKNDKDLDFCDIGGFNVMQALRNILWLVVLCYCFFSTLNVLKTGGHS